MTDLIEIADFENMLNRDDCDTSRIEDYIKTAKTCLKNNKKKDWENVVKIGSAFFRLSAEETIKRMNLNFNEKEIEENEILSEVAGFYGTTIDEVKKRLSKISASTEKGSEDKNSKGYDKYEYSGKTCYVIRYTIPDQNKKLIFSKSANNKLLKNIDKSEHGKFLTKKMLENNEINMNQLLDIKKPDKVKKFIFPVTILENETYRPATIEDFTSSQEPSSEQKSEVKPESQSSENSSPPKAETTETKNAKNK